MNYRALRNVVLLLLQVGVFVGFLSMVLSSEEAFPSAENISLNDPVRTETLERTILRDIQMAEICIWDYEENTGRNLATEALNLHDPTRTREDLMTARIQKALGDYYLNVGEKPDSATPFLEEALRIRLQLLDPPHKLLHESYFSLGRAAGMLDEKEKAKRMFRRSIVMREVIEGPCHILTGNAYNNLGAIFYDGDEHDSALVNFEKALEVFQEYPKYPSFQIDCINNIAAINDQLGNYSEAMKGYQITLEYELQEGDDPEKVVDSYANMGICKVHAGDFKEAEKYFAKAEAWSLNMKEGRELEMSWVKGQISTAYITGMEFEKALSEIQWAIHYLDPSYDPSDFREYPDVYNSIDPGFLMEHLAMKAQYPSRTL